MKTCVHCKTLLAALLVVILSPGCTRSDDVASLIAKAQSYRAKNERSAAVIELKNAVLKEPENAEARYVLGTVYIETGDATSAEKELRMAVERGYDRASAMPALGRAQLMQGHFQKLLDEVAVMPDYPPAAQAEVLTLRGSALRALGKQQEGEQLLDAALAKQPEFSDALLAKAVAAADKPAEARRFVERAIAASPSNVDAWLMKGELARNAGDSKTAMEAYHKAIDVRPDYVAAHLAVAYVAATEKRFDEARAAVARARKIDPGNVSAVYTQAYIQLSERDYKAAQGSIQQVLKAAPEHVPSLLLAGVVEYSLGNYSHAQSLLERVIERDPGSAYARGMLARALVSSGQAERAMDVVQAGLKISPAEVELTKLAGELSLRSQDYGKALQYFEAASKREPQSAVIRTGLGASRLALGETDRALADLDVASGMDSSFYKADVMAVLAHLQRKQYDEALTSLNKLEQKQPRNPLTHNLKAAAYSGKRDVANARKELERALELQFDYVPAAVNLARLDLQDKNQQAARGRLETILKKEPDNVQALLASAELGPAIGASQKEQVDWLQRASKAAPGAVQPRLVLAKVYARSGDRGKALDVIEQLQSAHPDQPPILDALGELQLETGQKQQAIATYSRLASLQPNSGYALYRLGTAQLVNGDASTALATLKKAVALQPDLVAAQVTLVQAEVLAGHYAEAMKIAQQLQKQAPGSALGATLQGDVLMSQKKPAEALKSYEAAYAIAPSGVLAMKMHSSSARAGKPREGEAHLSQWLRNAPDDAAVRLYAAEVYLSSAQYAKAVEQYEWLTSRQPDNAALLNNLAWSYQEAHDTRALATAERAYKLNPDNPAVADTLGWILVAQGETARGIELLQKAVAVAPNAASIRLHLAQAWHKRGDKEKARDEMDRAVAADPALARQPDAAALLKELRS